MKKLLARFRRAARGSSIGYFIQPRKVRFEWQDTPSTGFRSSLSPVILLMKLT